MNDTEYVRVTDDDLRCTETNNQVSFSSNENAADLRPRSKKLTPESVSRIKICSWNIHGLNEFKICQLNEYLQSFHIIMFNETWSKGIENYTIENFTLLVDGYRKSKHPLAIRNSGGICIFIHDDIKEGVQIHTVYKDITAWLKLDKAILGLENDIYLGCVYFPPEKSTCIEDDLFTILQSQIANIDMEAGIICAGDYNARCNATLSDIGPQYHGNDCHILENNEYFSNHDSEFIQYLTENNYYYRTSLDTGLNEYGRALINMCRAAKLLIADGRLGCEKHPGRYTYLDISGKSTPDHVLASPSAFKIIKDFEIYDKFPESDHLAINFSIPIGSKCNKHETNISLHKQLISRWYAMSKYVWHEADLPKLSNILEDTTSVSYYNKFKDSLTELHDSNKVALSYNNFVLQACDRQFHKINSNSSGKNKKRPQWYDTSCRLLRNKAIAAGKRIDSDSDRNLCVEACKTYRAYKQFKRRSYYHQCLDKIEIAYQSDRSNLWNTLSTFNPNLTIMKTPNKNDIFSYYSHHATPTHNAQFDYSYEKLACNHLSNYDNIDSIPMAIYMDPKLEALNSNFTEEEILSCIKSLKNKKSPGIDGIPGEFIKHNAENMVRDITLLFNYFIQTRDFPEAWAEGLRNPIYKAGPRLDPANYRGITVLPVFEKIFETAVHKRLEFIDDAFMLNDRHNSGFQKGSRTADNISILLGVIERHLILNQNVIVCFVDFSRAFDMINRNILFYKINQLGLHGRVIDTLQNLYQKTNFRIKHSGTYSQKIHETIGVNQGGNASPILFKKYLQDLKDYLQDHIGACIEKEFVQHILWADDLILISTRTPDAQIQLNGLSTFCSPNQMIVNNIKTKFMTFGKTIEAKLTFNNTIIEKVNAYKALGIIVNPTSSYMGNIFRSHPDYLCQQARKAIFGIYKRLKPVGEIPPKHMLYLYQSMIQPILTYGSELWGHNTSACESVDKLYYWFARSTLKVKASTSNIITLGECGVIPPSVYCHINLILYAIRLGSMRNGSIVNNVFIETGNMYNLGFKNWLYKVTAIANKYGIKLSMYTYSENVKKLIKTIIKRKFIDNWKESLNDTTKNPIVRTYKLFKYNFTLAHHLIQVRNSKYRIAISKFRCSSHLLAIERGRHTKPKTDICNRICYHCNIIEDEFHFLINCPLYDQERRNLFISVQSQYPNLLYLDNENKFILLLTSNDPQLLTSLGKYLYLSFQKRDDILNNK